MYFVRRFLCIVKICYAGVPVFWGWAFTISDEFICCLFTDYGVDKYDIGTGFGHFAIATQDVSVILLF